MRFWNQPMNVKFLAQGNNGLPLTRQASQKVKNMKKKIQIDLNKNKQEAFKRLSSIYQILTF
jgi:hypothetical protein